MNTNTHAYRNSFGHSPEAFHGCMVRALHEAQAEKPARLPILRTALVVCLITVLLASVAYAAARYLGLLEMYAAHHNASLTEQGRQILSQEHAPLAEATFGEIAVIVREAIYDGRCLYMSVALSHKDRSVILLGVDEGGAPDGVKQALRTSFAAISGEWRTDWSDYYHEEDGSLIYVTSGEFPLDGEELSVECLITATDLDASIGGVDSRRRETFVITVPVTPAIETLSCTMKETLDAVGITVDTVKMTRSPLAVYYEVSYTLLTTATERQREVVRNGLFVTPLDTKGNPLPEGMSLGSNTYSEDRMHYTCTGSLALETIPDAMLLEFYNGLSKERFGRLPVKLR